MEYYYKVIVMGDLGVGKTSLITRYIDKAFTAQYKATIMVDFFIKEMKVDNDNVRYHLWDIAGQNRYQGMIHTFYKDASGCILVFDLTSRKSFDSLMLWKNELDEKVRLSSGAFLPTLILGNKMDMKDTAVKEEDINILLEQEGVLGFFETSAKTGENVDDSIEFLFKSIHSRANFEPQTQDPTLIKLHERADRNDDDPNNGKCCKI